MTMRRYTGPRRKTIWANQRLSDTQLQDGQTDIGEIVGASHLLAEFESDYGHVPIGCTVTRIIGLVQVTATSETTAVPGTTGIVSLGICILDRDQSNVPDPTVDHFDWLWTWEARVFVQAGHSNSTPYPYLPETASQVLVDIRSQRKLDEGHIKLCLVASHSGMTVHTPSVRAYFRTLLKLP